MIFKSLTKAALGVVTIPVAAVADFITLGGSLTDKRRPYTAEACSDVVENLKQATRPERKTP